MRDLFCIYSISAKLPPKHYPLGHELRARHVELDCSMGRIRVKRKKGAFRKKGEVTFRNASL